ncbi:MAG: GxxExxY protein [candidate division WOR-3 bacterium]
MKNKNSTTELSEITEKKNGYPEIDLTKKIIAAAIEVHRILGLGLGEDVYEEAFTYELKLQGIPFERQKQISVPYKDIIAKTYQLDFLINNKVIVEIKAVSELNDFHKAQILSYLRAANLKVGLLINFNVKMLRTGIKRLISSKVK